MFHCGSKYYTIATRIAELNIRTTEVVLRCIDKIVKIIPHYIINEGSRIKECKRRLRFYTLVELVKDDTSRLWCYVNVKKYLKQSLKMIYKEIYSKTLLINNGILKNF